jgi:hypothetical protein
MQARLMREQKGAPKSKAEEGIFISHPPGREDDDSDIDNFGGDGDLYSTRDGKRGSELVHVFVMVCSNAFSCLVFCLYTHALFLLCRATQFHFRARRRRENVQDERQRCCASSRGPACNAEYYQVLQDIRISRRVLRCVFLMHVTTLWSCVYRALDF